MAENGLRHNRSAHWRTRFGCKQCKLRRVRAGICMIRFCFNTLTFRWSQCSAEKPQCHNCLRYGVDCVYMGGGTTQLISTGETETMLSPTRITAVVAAADIATQASTGVDLDSMVGFTPRLSQLNRYTTRVGYLFRHFQASTVLTIGIPPVVVVYQKEIFQLAFTVSHGCVNWPS